MGWAELSYQQNLLNELNNKLSGYKNSLENKKKRRTDVDDIYKKLQSVCFTDREKVNGYINRITGSIEAALKGIGAAGAIYSDAVSDMEKDGLTDGDILMAGGNLQSELSDIDAAVSQLNADISRTNGEINECRAAIRQEQRNIAIGYREDYYSAHWVFEQAVSAFRADPTSDYLRNEYYAAKEENDRAWETYMYYSDWL